MTRQDSAAPRLPRASAGRGPGPGVGGPRWPRRRPRPASAGRGLKEVHAAARAGVREMLETARVLVGCGPAAAADRGGGEGRGAGGRSPRRHGGGRRDAPPAGGWGASLAVANLIGRRAKLSPAPLGGT